MLDLYGGPESIEYTVDTMVLEGNIILDYGAFECPDLYNVHSFHLLQTPIPSLVMVLINH